MSFLVSPVVSLYLLNLERKWKIFLTVSLQIFGTNIWLASSHQAIALTANGISSKLRSPCHLLRPPHRILQFEAEKAITPLRISPDSKFQNVKSLLPLFDVANLVLDNWRHPQQTPSGTQNANGDKDSVGRMVRAD